jgi:hypothetical protein
MSNTHDMLHPSALHTQSLLAQREHLKHIDELSQSLDGFKTLWLAGEEWTSLQLMDVMCSMFHYTRS